MENPNILKIWLYSVVENFENKNFNELLDEGKYEYIIRSINHPV